MKFAICFSGSIRDFSSCYPSIKRYVLDNLNADIFLHLWKMDDISKLQTDVSFKWKNDTCTEQYVIEQLKPIRYVIDTYTNEWENKIISESKIDITKFSNDKLKNYGTNACGMYYKIYKANELLNEYSTLKGVKYDIVIRARLDFIWEDNITINNFAEANDQYIYLVKDRYANHSQLLTNDKFFAGTQNAMKKMCNLFNYIHEYQKKNLMIEGQILNEIHIRECKFEVKWIGHYHTYYKCMNRHNIKNDGNIILIGNDNKLSQFWFDLSYYLLYNNYNVIYLNDETNNTFKNILLAFSNFKIKKEKSIFDKIICSISSYYIHEINTKQILINNNIIANNTTNIHINANICTNDLIDFIYSIINTNKYGNFYNFIDKKLISDIEIGDKVIFKYMDKGYFLSTVVSYDKKQDKYVLQVGIKKINSSRENIKVFDLLKYYDLSNPSIMPINIHRYNNLIL